MMNQDHDSQSEVTVRYVVVMCEWNFCVAVDDRSMLRYIRDKTAAPYFSNLVWFIGGHVLELNDCIQHDTEYVTVCCFIALCDSTTRDSLNGVRSILVLEVTFT